MRRDFAQAGVTYSGGDTFSLTFWSSSSISIEPLPGHLDRYAVVDIGTSRQMAREEIRSIRSGLAKIRDNNSEKRELLAKISEMESRLDLLSDLEKKQKAREEVQKPSGRSIDLSEEKSV